LSVSSIESRFASEKCNPINVSLAATDSLLNVSAGEELNADVDCIAKAVRRITDINRLAMVSIVVSV
jgi:hypothetical protein